MESRAVISNLEKLLTESKQSAARDGLRWYRRNNDLQDLALTLQKKQRAARGSPFQSGGDEEDRTPDLRIANATLSQLSYVPSIRYAFNPPDRC